MRPSRFFSPIFRKQKMGEMKEGVFVSLLYEIKTASFPSTRLFQAGF